MNKVKAPRNRTLTLTAEELTTYQSKLIQLTDRIQPEQILDRIINQDLFQVLDWLPTNFVDLLFIDPPYNLTKSFGETAQFRSRSLHEYQIWLETWLPPLLKILKPTASVYICGDWRSAAAIHLVAEQHLIVRNCITWEREKGRGAKANWKNCSEQIWFCTVSDRYTFNVDAVKLKRRVMAPYTDSQGNPKDWQRQTIDNTIGNTTDNITGDTTGNPIGNTTGSTTTGNTTTGNTTTGNTTTSNTITGNTTTSNTTTGNITTGNITGNYRLTHPSNLWTDITIPFWSMPENTDHPTQKPEKLLAKIILASSQPGDVIFDPFLGSGTTAVVARKTDRHFSGIEIDPFYCCLTEKRLALAEGDRSIQGYVDGVFWERNALLKKH